jgi:hypothetical protein
MKIKLKSIKYSKKDKSGLTTIAIPDNLFPSKKFTVKITKGTIVRRIRTNYTIVDDKGYETTVTNFFNMMFD